MKLLSFSIFDVKADLYNTPFFFPTVAMALRAFADLANDPQSFVAKHPEDYKLVQVGTFDDSLGRLEGEPFGKFTSLGFASDYARQLRPQETPIGVAPPIPLVKEAS